MEMTLHRTRTSRHITSFIGRRKEIDEARARLQQSRLVSLLGPGGVGKTRLAEQIAERSARAFRDSYRWIDLASVRDSDALPSSAAAALGVVDQSNRDTMDKTIEYLRDKRVLIVLDNCEHLLEAASRFATSVLAGAPEAHILATSREPLCVGGEAIFDLPPLSTPPASSGYSAADVAVFESITLLVERAQSVVAGFELNDSNADSIAELCIQLDGIPLAIELAAVRLRSLSPSQLVQRLDRRFELLTGGDRSNMPRQQTLKALSDWSYDLCSDAERTLWARLSVFSGGLDLDAAEDVCSGGILSRDGVIEVLDGLVAKSLVRVDRSADELRYSQLMTVREYGHDLLETSGDSAAVYRLHRDHYLMRAQSYADDWFSPRQSKLLASLRLDHFNLISALDWSLRTEEVNAAAAMSVALRYHWIAGGYLSDGRLRLERLLAHLASEDDARGDVLWVTAWTALIQGDRDGALNHLTECADIALRLDDVRLHAHYDHWAGLHALFSGRIDDAISLLSRALEVHRARSDNASVLTASFMLAMAQAYDGQIEQSLATCYEVIEIADGHGERWNKAYALWMSSVAHFHLGQTEETMIAVQEALTVQRDFKDKICTALSIEVLAWTKQALGHTEHAAQLFGAANSVWQLLGTSVAAFGPHIERDSSASMNAIRDTLDVETFKRCTRATTDLSIVDSVGLALGAVRHQKSNADPVGSVLTKRESEVAALVAEGLGNKEIAAKLVISRRTVDGHVERIFSKLGIGSRTQIVVWMQARTIL